MSQAPAVIEHVLRASFERLAKPVYVALRRRITGAFFERPSGIETEEIVRLADLGAAAKDRVDYVPSGWLSLRRILPRREVAPDDVFADFGSGKGRIVFLAAAHYPFKRVIGVEFLSELHATAQRNIERTIHRLRCKNIELVNRDVLDYDVPDDVTIAYFQNPFTGHVFEAVIDKLIASMDRNPRAIRIVYANPVEEEFLLSKGARLVRTARGRRPSREWSRSRSIRLYELSPDDKDRAQPVGRST